MVGMALRRDAHDTAAAAERCDDVESPVLVKRQALRTTQDGNLYVVASFGGRRGVVRISPQGHAEHVLSGSALVGLALLPSGRGILAANSSLFTIDWNVRGLPLHG